MCLRYLCLYSGNLPLLLGNSHISIISRYLSLTIFFFIWQHLDYHHLDFRVNVLINCTVISILWCRWSMYLVKGLMYSNKERGKWETYRWGLIVVFFKEKNLNRDFFCFPEEIEFKIIHRGSYQIISTHLFTFILFNFKF